MAKALGDDGLTKQLEEKSDVLVSDTERKMNI